MALPWAMLDVTGSIADAGVVLFWLSVPYATLGFFVGPLLDRGSFRSGLIGADIVRAVLVALFGGLLVANVGSLVVYSLIAVGVGIGTVVASSAREAVVPDLTRDLEGVGLVQINAYMQVARDVASAVGPLVGGFLVATVGAAPTLFVDASTYVVSAVLTGMSIRADGGRGNRKPGGSLPGGSLDWRSYWDELREGWGFVVGDRLVRFIVSQSALTNMLVGPFLGLLLVAYAKQELGDARILGMVLGAFGLGSILGGMTFGSRPSLMRSLAMYGPLLLGVVLPLWALLSVALAAWATGLFVSGWSNMGLNIMGDTVLQIATPPGMRARAFGTAISGLALLEPIGLAAAGALASLIGLQGTMRLFLGLLTLVGLVVTVVGARLARTFPLDLGNA